MTEQISKLQEAIKIYREQLFSHPVYEAICDTGHLHCFMEHHIYAVWDFMSLLKSLQKDLTCITVPWFPAGSASTRYLINEIVIGEESDVDESGKRMSHYELYLQAMAQCGAATRPFETFIAVLQQTGNFTNAFLQAGTPQSARDFVNYTFEVIGSGQLHRI